MAKKVYLGVNSVARNVKGMFLGVDNVARKVKKGYIGVNGVAHLFWEAYAGPLAVAFFDVGPTDGHGSTPFYFRCDVTGGKPPYTYKYYISRNSAEYGLLATLTGAKPTWGPGGQTGNYRFRVAVTDSEGTTVENTMGFYLFRYPHDGALSLSLSAAYNQETGVATWSLSPASTQECLLILKDGAYHHHARRTSTVSLLLTEPGTYTAIGAYTTGDSTSRVVTGGEIVI